MQISVVIPTRNRKDRLFRLLQSLAASSDLIGEIVIADSSDLPFPDDAFEALIQVPVRYFHMEAGVCLQRNAGVRLSRSEWVLLCDDDVEVPAAYLPRLLAAIHSDPALGAVSGLMLQEESGKWVPGYPVCSRKELLLKFVFGLGIWGEIHCDVRRWPFSSIARHYAAKGNHISAAGWPVLTKFDAPAFDAPAYALVAALIRRDWLLKAAYDEVLDAHGIGDNFGVIQKLPARSVRVVTDAVVYHYREPENRLKQATAYYRRALALDYYRRTMPSLSAIRRGRMLWSLFGNWLIYTVQRKTTMRRAAWKTLQTLLFKPNPYEQGSRRGERLVTPAFE